MNIDEWIYDRLNTDVTDVEGRIDPNVGSALTAKPYIVYTQIAEEPMPTHNLQNVGTRKWMYQIDCVASTPSAAYTLSMQAKAALLDHIGDGVLSVVAKGSRSTPDVPDSRDHGRSFDVEIMENLT